MKKTTVKTIILSVCMFIMGIAGTLMVIRWTVVPDLVMDVAKYGYESCVNGYEYGYQDACNNTYHDLRSCDDVQEIENWEYKYIR